MLVPTDVASTLDQPTWPVRFASLKTVGNLLGHWSLEIIVSCLTTSGFSEQITLSLQIAPGESFAESVQSQFSQYVITARSFVGNSHKRKTRALVKNNKFRMTRELNTPTCCSEELFIRAPKEYPLPEKSTASRPSRVGIQPSKLFRVVQLSEFRFLGLSRADLSKSCVPFQTNR